MKDKTILYQDLRPITVQSSSETYLNTQLTINRWVRNILGGRKPLLVQLWNILSHFIRPMIMSGRLQMRLLMDLHKNSWEAKKKIPMRDVQELKRSCWHLSTKGPSVLRLSDGSAWHHKGKAHIWILRKLKGSRLTNSTIRWRIIGHAGRPSVNYLKLPL